MKTPKDKLFSTSMEYSIKVGDKVQVKGHCIFGTVVKWLSPTRVVIWDDELSLTQVSPTRSYHPSQLKRIQNDLNI